MPFKISLELRGCDGALRRKVIVCEEKHGNRALGLLFGVEANIVAGRRIIILHFEKEL